jgi:hypothetical protein
VTDYVSTRRRKIEHIIAMTTGFSYFRDNKRF